MTSPVDLTALDVASLAVLAGDSAAREVLAIMGGEGHGEVRASHGYVFQRLVDAEPTIGELAASLGITQQGASKHVAELERLGYAERIPDAGDQRVRRVRMTTAGRDLLEAGRAARRDLEDRLVAAQGADDVATARRVLVGLLDITGDTRRVASREAPLPG